MRAQGYVVLEPVQADYLFAMLGGRPRSAPAGASSSAGAPAGAAAEAHARKLAASIAQARWPAAGCIPENESWGQVMMKRMGLELCTAQQCTGPPCQQMVGVPAQDAHFVV